jgi:predicted nucleic acid-binding Zn ribbon protein
MKKAYRCTCGAETIRKNTREDNPDFIDCSCGSKMKKVIELPPVHFKAKDFTKGIA